MTPGTPRDDLDDLDNLHPGLKGPDMRNLRLEGQSKIIGLVHALVDQKEALHQTGGCKPCAFVGRQKGCQRMVCKFCHDAVHVEEQRLKKQERAWRRSSEYLAQLSRKKKSFL